MVNILNLRLLVLLGPDYPRLTERLRITDLCCTGNTKCGWQCVVLGPCVVGVPGQVLTAPFVDCWHLNAWMNVSCLFIDYYFKIFISDVHWMLIFLMQVVYKGKYIYLIIEIYYFIAQLISQSKFTLFVFWEGKNFFLLPQNTNRNPVFSSVVTLVMILAFPLVLD